MKIEAYTYSTNKYNNNINNMSKDKNNVSFEGINFLKALPKNKRKASYLNHFMSKYAGYLELDFGTAKSTLEGMSDKRLSFFKSIAERYNGQNFYSAQKEDQSIPLRIFNSVKKPDTQHFYILRHIDGSFEDLEKFMQYADDKKYMKFIQDFHKKYRGLKYRDKYLIEMLESENRDIYLKDIDRYKSYLLNNSENINSVKELNKLVSQGEFNQAEHDITFTLKLLNTHGKNTNSTLKSGLLEEHYSPEGLSLLRKLSYEFTFYTPNESQLKEFLRIYNTTNKDNIKLRKDFIEAFRYSADNSSKKSIVDSELIALRELFESADKDKHVYNFMEKSVTQGAGTKSIEEISDILKVVPAKNADIFFDNVSRITAKLHGESRYYALVNHLDDPFYADNIIAKQLKREGHVPFRTESILSIAKRFIDNKINQFRLGNSKHAQETVPDIPPTMKNRVITGADTVFSREMAKIPKDKALVPIPQTLSILEKTLAQINSKIQEAEKLEQIRKLEIKRTLKEAKEAKKLKLVSDINGVISKKLGKKTFEDQSVDYQKKATKIRLSLLPHIFDSIKTTRKNDRILGVKESVSSKDALELYKRINGHNRKIVRYMLLKEHQNTNTRVFTIKDIINFIDNSEKIIAQNKVLDKNYKPKEYYDLMYDMCSSTFGKLPAGKKSKK